MATPTFPLAESVERLAVLDEPGQAVGERVRELIGPGPLKDAISGTWLGHALHPLLTDVTIGSFISATLLDLLGGDDDGRAAQRLIAIGLASYGPTALTGVSDWADTEITDEKVRRVGLVHAATNAVAATCFASSLVARRRGRRGRGKLLGLAGAAALSAAGYLGAHMSYVQGVGPNQTAFDQVPDGWMAVIAAGDLELGQAGTALVGDAPVLLVRHEHGIHALHDRCSHRGCLLSDGELDGESVVCACHGSRFALGDGSVERGPATAPQPAFETREREGQVELRPRGSN